MSATRLVTPDDAAILADLLRANRDFLAPWDPIRDDDFFTVAGQRRVVRSALEQHEQGSALPHVIVDVDGRVVGRVSLTRITRAPFQSCTLGYWVSAADNGRGLAAAAVHDIVQAAYDGLGLHRIEASTQVHNVKSQRVLERNGFFRIGVAAEYLNIDGDWKDVALYQLVKSQRDLQPASPR
ncbi:MAG: [ribosomal protein S5]-alanine N-acetyltransferase [Kribbellaceae bacterium]|nr:[ribosomal protein S5]-alanine N-acetyltransferase [Kribbellaceae bacterium]